MARYTPPEQSKGLQLFDVVCVVVAIFLALWLPLYLTKTYEWFAKLAGVSKSMTKIDNPTWEALAQTPAQVEQWNKLGFADAASAHDIIQNKWDYTINGQNLINLIILAAVLVGYFLFLFKASDKEYREVIDEKFNGK